MKIFRRRKVAQTTDADDTPRLPIRGAFALARQGDPRPIKDSPQRAEDDGRGLQR